MLNIALVLVLGGAWEPMSPSSLFWAILWVYGVGMYVFDLTKTVKPKSKIASTLFPFTDTLMVTFKQKTTTFDKWFSREPILGRLHQDPDY